MTTYRITGGRRLSGKIGLEGAKNAALPLIFAASLGEEISSLGNVPLDIGDVQILIDLLRKMGAEIATVEGRLECSRGSFPNGAVPVECVSKIRSSILLLGACAGLKYELDLPLPGGCAIGVRGHDLHVMGLGKLGAQIDEVGGHLKVRPAELRGAEIEFYLPTTTGTQNVMLAGCFASGTTRILNANTRPENQTLAELLRLMGARVISRNRVVEVTGTHELRGGVRFDVPIAWDEAVTWMTGAAVTGGEIQIDGLDLRFIREDARTLREAGVEVFEWGGAVYVSAQNPLKPFDAFTGPYPAINSDMQPMYVALAVACAGESTITDMRFPERFRYVDELTRLGADVDVFGNCAVVRGGSELRGAVVTAPDLRGGAALVLAGLQARGETRVLACDQIERGYSRMWEKINALGGEAERLT